MTHHGGILCFLYSRTKRKDYRFLTSNDGIIDVKQLNSCLETNSKRFGKREVLFTFESLGELAYLLLFFRTTSSDERGRKIDAVIGFDLSNSKNVGISEFVSEALKNLTYIIETTNYLIAQPKNTELGVLTYSYEKNAFSIDKVLIEIVEEKSGMFKMRKSKSISIHNEEECLMSSRHFYSLPELPDSYKNFKAPQTMIEKTAAKSALRNKNSHHFNEWPDGIYSSGFSRLFGEVRDIDG